MSREIRKVPKDWAHPIDPRGHHHDGSVWYIPQHDGSRWHNDSTDYDEEKAKWDRGEYPDYASEDSKKLSYEAWNGKRPERNRYMPVWAEEEKTHFMLYETTTEGTPKSPAFDNIEELAQWLAVTKATTFGREVGSYETWLAFCQKGSTCGVGFVMDSDGSNFATGVDVVAKQP
jgi:hypothetical protein